MLTLYHNDMSVCAAKVRTALNEKGVDFKLIHLDLRAGDTQKPEYLKLNPNAVVPTLVHDDRVIIESAVICEYIDDEWLDPPLKPTNSFGRARMRLWTRQLDEGLHAAVGSLSFAIAFRHQWLARSANDRSKWLAGIPQPDRRERLASLLDFGLESPYFAPAVKRYGKLFDAFEAALEHGPGSSESNSRWRRLDMLPIWQGCDILGSTFCSNAIPWSRLGQTAWHNARQ